MIQQPQRLGVHIARPFQPSETAQTRTDSAPSLLPSSVGDRLTGPSRSRRGNPVRLPHRPPDANAALRPTDLPAIGGSSRSPCPNSSTGANRPTSRPSSDRAVRSRRRSWSRRAAGADLSGPGVGRGGAVVVARAARRSSAVRASVTASAPGCQPLPAAGAPSEYRAGGLRRGDLGTAGAVLGA